MSFREIDLYYVSFAHTPADEFYLQERIEQLKTPSTADA